MFIINLNKYNIFAQMKIFKVYTLVLLSTLMFSCDEDNDPTSKDPVVEAPDTYSYIRGNESSVSFGGQTTRIGMAEELIGAMKDFEKSEEALLEMYRNETATGADANPFSTEDLNASTKSIKSKVAQSKDFFSANTSESSAIKAAFESWIKAQVEAVFPNKDTLAVAGTAGQIADGTSTRYINEKGLEYNQAVAKSLIGALMLDQALNNYLGTAVLDEGENRANNDAGILEEGKNYTAMEHKWDEAYGYVYGASVDTADPNKTIGSDDSFLNKYIGRVESDTDFSGTAKAIFDAFNLGRAAIVAKNYTQRDAQVAVLRAKLSEIIAIRAVYYLQQGKNAFASNKGGAFHDLSEGYGFVYSLRFTRKPGTNDSYFSKTEVDGFLADMMGDGDNGLWDVKAETLDNIAAAIAAKFDFTVAQAAE